MNSKFYTLEKLNEQIEKIDLELLYLLKRRVQTEKKVAIFKKGKNLGLDNFNLANEIIIKNIAKARTMQLNENFVREIFEVILDETNRVQKDIMEEKN